MNQYVKPTISIASGITEGIYTASGVTPNAITLGALEVIADWGTNGQVKFIADFSVLSNRCPLTLTVTFNAIISNAWVVAAIQESQMEILLVSNGKMGTLLLKRPN